MSYWLPRACKCILSKRTVILLNKIKLFPFSRYLVNADVSYRKSYTWSSVEQICSVLIWTHVVLRKTDTKKKTDSLCVFMKLKKNLRMKRRQRSLSFSGMGGCVLNIPTLNIAACGEPSSTNGGRPVAISTIVHPKLQISAGAPYPRWPWSITWTVYLEQWCNN